MKTEALEPRFLSLCRDAGLDANTAQKAFYRLLDGYFHQGRHYHTMLHILDCLEKFDQVRALLIFPIEVELALWFHDLVYDTHRTDNEVQSALEFERFFCDHTDIQTEYVKNLIIATTHTDPVWDQDTNMVCDIDLASLGYDMKIFDENTLHIRREYEWVPREAFINGRRRILQSFLERPRIYHTDYFYLRYEERARANLHRSVANLESLITK